MAWRGFCVEATRKANNGLCVSAEVIATSGLENPHYGFCRRKL